MSNWEGFTDEDLKRVKHQAVRNDGSAVSRGGTRGRPGFRKKPQRSGLKPEMENKQEQPGLLPDQRLSAPPKKHDSGRGESIKTNKTEKTESKEKTGNTGPGEVTSNQDTGKDSREKSNPDGWESNLKEEAADLMDEEEIVSLEISNMDRFREQQKMIEELNKKKRQLLASAIQKRQKQAKVEAVKLMQIQKELDKLDQLLTVDVSIIRDRIEDASREYMEAQKKYDRAEKEFITSKMHLFETQENKEHLTEHLYTVIHQNEVRKARKLKELMDKLEMGNSGEDGDLSELVSHMEIPSLTVLNSMQVKTIHGPKSPPANARILSVNKLSPANNTEQHQGRQEDSARSQTSEGTADVQGRTEVIDQGQMKKEGGRESLTSEVNVSSEGRTKGSEISSNNGNVGGDLKAEKDSDPNVAKPPGLVGGITGSKNSNNIKSSVDSSSASIKTDIVLETSKVCESDGKPTTATEKG